MHKFYVGLYCSCPFIRVNKIEVIWGTEENISCFSMYHVVVKASLLSSLQTWNRGSEFCCVQKMNSTNTLEVNVMTI